MTDPVSLRTRPGLLRDLSLSAVMAGMVAVLVGYTSSAAIVFQAAQASGADAAGIASWMWALGIGCGLTSFGLSWYYRNPVVTAWSTPGAALLATSAMGLSMAESVGAFVAVGALIVICGVTGWFARALSRIPMSLASAMLAGILLRFGMDVFVAMQSRFGMVLAMFLAYLLGRRRWQRYAVPGALAAGMAVAALQGGLLSQPVRLEIAVPVFTLPVFSWDVLVGVALPLFVVTMASQNVPGVATIRAAGYDTPVSAPVAWTGLATGVLAPFGAFSINLAAITAAICMSRDVHEDTSRRYVAAMSAGVCYLFLGVFGATIGALLAAFPRELVLAIAGLALINTIGSGLVAVVQDEQQREPALIAFLVTASGASLFGISSAFWGLVAGVVAMVVLRRR